MRTGASSNSRMVRRGAATKRGVTLIEALVSIGVVAVLVSLLLPGLGAMRLRARASECQSHLRQIALGALAYANASNEHLPPAILYFMRDGALVSRGWDYTQTGTAWFPGTLWEFIGDGRVLQSPDLPEPMAPGSDPFTGYNYNTTYLGAEGSLPGPGVDGTMLEGWANARRGAAPAQIRRPADCAFFGEGGWKGGTNRFMRAPMNSVEFNPGVIYSGGQAFRRGRGTIVAALDGHVSIHDAPHEGPHAQAWLLQFVMDFPRNGFLSQDDSAYDPR